MNWNQRVRQTHRALAITFAITVVVTIVAMALQGPAWTAYLPLPPLAVLLFSGFYLFVLPYAVVWRDRKAGESARVRQARPTAPRTRKVHRWSAAACTVAILATSLTLALQGPIWVSYLPLPPLAGLLLSGLYMFTRPRTTGQITAHELYSDPIEQSASPSERSSTAR